MGIRKGYRTKTIKLEQQGRDGVQWRWVTNPPVVKEVVVRVQVAEFETVGACLALSGAKLARLFSARVLPMTFKTQM